LDQIAGKGSHDDLKQDAPEVAQIATKVCSRYI
jgi:hypothetical protein